VAYGDASKRDRRGGGAARNIPVKFANGFGNESETSPSGLNLDNSATALRPKSRIYPMPITNSESLLVASMSIRADLTSPWHSFST
jgi:hypothetical protein